MRKPLPQFNSQDLRKKLYLHVGFHKTGSTSIQTYLFRNRKVLGRSGLLYPTTGLEHSAHHRIAWACGTGRHAKKPELVNRYVEQLRKEASASSVENVIVSSEEFESSHEIPYLESLTKEFDVKVVVYVRKQDHMLESAYNQHLRQYDLRFSGGIYQFAFKYNFFNRLNYRIKLERWEKVFGRENILVRHYGTTNVAKDVCEDLLSIVSPEHVSDYVDARRSSNINVSLPAAALPYLARLNKLALSSPQHQHILRKLETRFANAEAGRSLSNLEAQEFYSKFEASNRYIAKRYLNLSYDPFHELLKSDSQKTHIPFDAATEELVLEYFSFVLWQRSHE
ncbi:MAG: hypothetical protein AAF699_05885 [Pseudomonadota bacterium]